VSGSSGSGDPMLWEIRGERVSRRLVISSNFLYHLFDGMHINCRLPPRRTNVRMDSLHTELLTFRTVFLTLSFNSLSAFKRAVRAVDFRF